MEIHYKKDLMWEASLSLQTFFGVLCSYNYTSSELSFSLFLNEPSVLGDFLLWSVTEI